MKVKRTNVERALSSLGLGFIGGGNSRPRPQQVAAAQPAAVPAAILEDDEDPEKALQYYRSVATIGEPPKLGSGHDLSAPAMVRAKTAQAQQRQQISGDAGQLRRTLLNLRWRSKSVSSLDNVAKNNALSSYCTLPRSQSTYSTEPKTLTLPARTNSVSYNQLYSKEAINQVIAVLNSQPTNSLSQSSQQQITHSQSSTTLYSQHTAPPQLSMVDVTIEPTVMPERVGSASSQATSSESGRGTLNNKHTGPETPSGHEDLSDRSDSYNHHRGCVSAANSRSNFAVVDNISRHQQQPSQPVAGADLNGLVDSHERNIFFQQKRNRNPMPLDSIVDESESENWVSPSSGIRQAINTKSQPKSILGPVPNASAAATAGGKSALTALNKQNGPTEPMATLKKQPSAMPGPQSLSKPMLAASDPIGRKKSNEKTGSTNNHHRHHQSSYLGRRKDELRLRDGGCKTLSAASKTKAWLEGQNEIASTTTCNDFDDEEDLASQFTTATSTVATPWAAADDNASAINTTNQIKKLHDMYGEILKSITTKLNNRSAPAGGGGREKTRPSLLTGGRRKKPHGSGSVISMSTITSIADSYRPGRRRGRAEESGSARMKRLENHVVTLARSLSSEIRNNHQLVQELASQRTEIDRLREQLKVISGTLDSLTKAQVTLAKVNGGQPTTPVGAGSVPEPCYGTVLPKSLRKAQQHQADLNANKVDKPTRFLGAAEPPALKHFLRKLGYEKYTATLENEKIGLNELYYMDEEKLKKLGLPMGPRVRILQEVQQLFKGGNGSSRMVRSDSKYNFYIV